MQALLLVTPLLPLATLLRTLRLPLAPLHLTPLRALLLPLVTLLLPLAMPPRLPVTLPRTPPSQRTDRRAVSIAGRPSARRSAAFQ
jgi:hypothetical protein